MVELSALNYLSAELPTLLVPYQISPWQASLVLSISLLEENFQSQNTSLEAMKKSFHLVI